VYSREKHKRYNIQSNKEHPPVGLNPGFHWLSVKQKNKNN